METVHVTRVKTPIQAASAASCANISCTHYHPDNYSGALTLLADEFHISQEVLEIIKSENIIAKTRSAGNTRSLNPPIKLFLKP